MKRRFEQNQQDCVFTVLSLLPTLGDQLLHELNVELITAKLQQTRSQRPTPAPTPDSSMILPPKPSTEQQERDEQEDSRAAFSTEEVQQQREQGSADNNNENENTEVSDKTEDDQEAAAAAATIADAEDVRAKVDSTDSSATSDTNGDSNHSTEPSSTSSEVDKEETKTAQETTAAAATTARSEDQEAPTAATTAVDVAPQPIVKDEATLANERKTKLELWNELKIMSFTRTVTALYSLTFLTLLTQVQLNLLGRFTYVSSVIALSNTTDASYRVESPAVKGSLSSTQGQLDFQTEKKYLTFSYWLLHEGWRRWSEKVREVVEDVVGG